MEENFDLESFYDMDPYYGEDGFSVFETELDSDHDGYVSVMDNWDQPERFYL